MNTTAKRWGHAIPVLFFSTAALYPSLRVLWLGSRTASGFTEILFSVTPDLLLIGFFLAAAAHKYDEVQRGETPWWKTLNPVDKSVALFLLFNVVYGLILGADPLLAAYSIRLTYLPVLMFFGARWLYLEESHERLNAFVARLMLVLAVIGLVLYFFFSETVEAMMRAGNYFQSVYFVPRLTSLFWNPIMYASVAGLGVLCFFSSYLQSGNSRWLLPMYAVLLSLFLSVSRGGIWSCLIASLLLVVVTQKWRRGGFVYLQLAVVFGVAWSIPYLHEILVWFIESTRNTLDGEGSVSRVVLWQRSWRDFLDKPFGFGLGKAGHVAYRFLLDSDVRAAVWSTDGWYLKMANETGIPGLVTIVILFVTAALFFVRHFKVLASLPSVWLTGAVLFVAVQCVVSNVLDFFFVAPLFWFLFGLLINDVERHERKQANR